MENSPNPNREDPLLDAVLKEESWAATDDALRSFALGAFRIHQRRRRRLRWTTGAIASVILGLLAFTIIRRPPELPPPVGTVQVDAPGDYRAIHFLKDDELEKMFPPGSCLIVEVNNQKQLFFLDPEVEREAMVR